MVATKPTGHHSLPGQALGILVITLALALGAVAGYAALSIGAAGFAARAAGGPPVLRPGGWVPPPVTSPSATPDATPTVAPSASSTPDPTPTPNPTPAPAVAATATPAVAGDGKVIVVSIAAQRLTAYKDGVAVLATVVATGMPELATPRGTYHIKNKYTPYTFVSPWPRGDRFWYPTVTVSWAMLFADEGFFLHDSPHRTVYGPGANLTNGTHGCVNIPVASMGQLYQWANVGTTVVIQ